MPKPHRVTRVTRPDARARTAPRVPSAGGGRARLWLALGALALVALFVAARTPTLGMAVADDYTFLERLRFQHPLDPFDSMGAAFYWRPVSRQLYFSLVGPWLLSAPWAAAALHALLLLALYAVLWRIARRGFPPGVAAAVAAFPLLSEPARVLLAWPSAGQHVLAMLFAALAVERALAGRRLHAALVALLALLSHETAAVVLPVLPFVTWVRARELRAGLVSLGGVLVVAALWGAGYAAALHHGVKLPGDTYTVSPLAGLLPVLARGLTAQLDLEDASPAVRDTAVLLYGALALLALGLAAGRRARARLAAAAPALLGGAAWFLATLAPLALVFPDWNAWRTSVASLGLAVALAGTLGLVRPWLAGVFTAVRLAALLAAPAAPAVVEMAVPLTTSDFSFVRIVRLQRTVESARRVMLARHPVLPRAAQLRFWQQPRLAEVGFQSLRAARVWYRDSALDWHAFGGKRGLHQRPDALVEFEIRRPWPAVVIEPAALLSYLAASDSMIAGNLRAADSLMLAAWRVQPGDTLIFHGILALNRARLAWDLRDFARADSLNQWGQRYQGESSGYWAMSARFALLRGDRGAADVAVRRCLTIDPADEDGLLLQRAYGLAGGARP
ncbi:MAG: hypothetical protein HZC42_03740 [Candidatus Eisenbacteria bacterium]|nr:hypothetical protein [Candidatus Eisenbacteria bacterium]